MFPDGAYVPNAWIDIATDSTAMWRKGSEENRVRINTVVSLSHEKRALEEQNFITSGQLAKCTTRSDECFTNNAQLQDNLIAAGQTIRVRGNWNIVLGISTILFATTTTALAISHLR